MSNKKQTKKQQKQVYILRHVEARTDFTKLGYKLANAGSFVAIGDQSSAKSGLEVVEVFEGYFMGFSPRRAKNKSNTLLFLRIDTKEQVKVFSSTVLDSAFLNEDETKAKDGILGRACVIVYQGIRGKGQNAYKNYDVFFHPKKALTDNQLRGL